MDQKTSKLIIVLVWVSSVLFCSVSVGVLTEPAGGTLIFGIFMGLTTVMVALSDADQ